MDFDIVRIWLKHIRRMFILCVCVFVLSVVFHPHPPPPHTQNHMGNVVGFLWGAARGVMRGLASEPVLEKLPAFR